MCFYSDTHWNEFFPETGHRYYGSRACHRYYVTIARRGTKSVRIIKDFSGYKKEDYFLLVPAAASRAAPIAARTVAVPTGVRCGVALAAGQV